METDKIQFGFKSGCGITNMIFILRQLYEKYLAKKKKNLYFVFADLEKVLQSACLEKGNYKGLKKTRS